MQELNLFTTEGKAYAEFIVNEVKPWVEKNFTHRNSRVIML
jgi:predicted alpha/beta superfamily hydrolase